MYYTYMLRCDDNSIYTGITTDLDRRFKQHQGKVVGGAKYTKSRKPLKYEVVWQSETRQSASKLEYRIKKLSKDEKEVIVKKTSRLADFVVDKLDIDMYILLDFSTCDNVK